MRKLRNFYEKVTDFLKRDYLGPFKTLTIISHSKYKIKHFINIFPTKSPCDKDRL